TDYVAFGIVYIPEEIGDAEPALLVLAREREPGQLAFFSPWAGLVEQDQFVALRGAAPITVGGLRRQDVLADRDVADARQHRPQFLFRPLLVFGEGAAVLPVAPLELVQHALVEIRHDRLGRYPGNRLRSPERRLRHRHAAIEFGPAQFYLFQVDRPLRPGIAGATELAALVD